MFVDPTKILDVTIYYKRKGYLFVAYSKKDFNKLNLTTEQKEDYKELNAKMKILTWGMNNDLNESAMTEDNEGNRKFNYKMFKENKLQKLLDSWDAKDESDNPVPINANTLSKLAPSIAEVILTTYDDLSGTSEEELGN